MIREGDKVWIVPNAGGELHPAIVIRISKDQQYAVVAAGTGTKRVEFNPIEVDPSRRVYKALRFSKKTYFYQNAVHVRAIAEITVRDTPAIRCPLALWGPLQVLARAGAQSKLSDKDFREWWPEDDGIPQGRPTSRRLPNRHLMPTRPTPQ
jgi:hypothetical protein